MIPKNITEMLKNDSDSRDDRDDESEVLEEVTTSKLSKTITDCNVMK